MEILNNGDEAREMAKAIEKTADTFSLSQVNGSVGCVDVSVEEDCVSSYERGISLTKQLIEHVQKASGYIQQINDTLENADLHVAARVSIGVLEGAGDVLDTVVDTADKVEQAVVKVSKVTLEKTEDVLDTTIDILENNNMKRVAKVVKVGKAAVNKSEDVIDFAVDAVDKVQQEVVGKTEDVLDYAVDVLSKIGK